MAFHYLTNVPLEQAREEYLQLLIENGLQNKTECIPVFEACGRITSEAVYAHICAPHYHASAMDGIAVQASSTFGATETTPIRLTPAQYIVVDTGDPLPENCDAVIMVEDIVKEENGDVRIYNAAAPWQHIRQIGEDICAGEMILPSYTTVSPSAIGALLAGGILEINVIKKPVIGIIPTGDEIIPPTSDPAPGDIIEFNSSIFSAMVRQWGAEAVTFPIVPDKFDIMKQTVTEALEKCDIVLLNAGSSAGREDYSEGVIRELGGVLYHGIAMKPGKPAILGYQNEKAIIGVPGYPVSGIIVIEQLLKPIIEYINHAHVQQDAYVEATLSRAVVSGLKYQEFVRVRMGYVAGKLIASPLSRGAGVVSSFMKADGILEIPQGQEGYEAGSTVSVRLLRPLSELQNTLVAIGSHDPLLDEVSNLLHRKNPNLYMASSHVGSMGGIMAVRRGETHMAGIHLLNEKDGTYNTAFVKKYFPNGGVRVVECVGRTQGIMVAPGNPKNITEIKSLSEQGIRYVNRQKGSGTRILIDYLCKKENIDTTAIYGYDREEFTHTSVAAQIASGSADAGMGIYSAAQLYGLDFIPICIEQYDLLIPDSAWDTDVVQEVIQILKSEEFSQKLTEMGGYTLEHPGEVRYHL
ncbi:MAG: molybdopterin biosynthesis protein [Lachnospiraceae bacterium]|nr:molybdopterin biosynthesis protein [Lachnospiraceae bacterium]